MGKILPLYLEKKSPGVPVFCPVENRDAETDKQKLILEI